MKAIVLRKHGNVENLQIREIAEPQPGSGEVRVKLQAIGLNYAEIQSRKGLYGWAPKLPYVLGMEGFGQIDAIGEDVENHSVGDHVITVAQFGAYAEKIVVPKTQALPAITYYSVTENVAFAVQYMTAWVGLFEVCRLKPTDTVLIQAAAGGVGTAAVQLAKAFGCRVFGTVGSDHKKTVVENLGIDGVINYRKQDFAAEMRRLNSGNGVDVVLEVVGGEVFRKSLALLNPFGRLVVIGFASLNLKKWNPVSIYRTLRAIPRVNISKMAERSYAVGASHLGYLLKNPKLMQQVWTDLTDFVRKHNIRPVVGHSFKFDQMTAAHKLMESRQSTGKIVVEIDNE
ncbi:MAG: zinc-binding dehydrogenase [Candidatus Marinimicrobia bacterium]|nr:zinc-binding dehydrogenase [Candidatus Neomarinimicrobiota bacterium]